MNSHKACFVVIVKVAEGKEILIEEDQKKREVLSSQEAERNLREIKQ